MMEKFSYNCVSVQWTMQCVFLVLEEFICHRYGKSYIGIENNRQKYIARIIKIKPIRFRYKIYSILFNSCNFLCPPIVKLLQKFSKKVGIMPSLRNGR